MIKDKEDDLITEINVTPLVDIILVILIIFLLVAQIVGPQVFKIKLPKASHGEIEKKPITISIDKDGRYFLEGFLVGEEEIRRSARKWVSLDPETSFIISADHRVSHGKVVHILDILKGEGVKRLGIHVQPE